MKKKNNYLELFKTFLKIGTFTFGGGYAMLSIIKHEVVDNKKWITEEEFTNIVTIAESTPGPIAINVATYVGYKTAGNLGSLFATLGTIFSPVIIILILSSILNVVSENEIFNNAFLGIRIGAVALIFSVLFNMYKGCKKNIYTYVAIAISLVLLLAFDVSSIYIILGFMALRLIMYAFKVRKERV